ncbi:MAG: UDP-3-O-[3-hydroxymyristoyl] N-acetylglucosamine deacetylase [Firmicutes bacterium]|nr:UDP-3-O-[3-hydroxymyristoyl] N-acetylglucosamine deacetylase [Bacillota bacterium]
MVTQRTLAGSTVLRGIGLHTGVPVSVELHPAAAGHGISFCRADLPDFAGIAAHPANVVSTDRCTVLGQGGVSVRTVEHLMAAFYATGITNCKVIVSAEELPVLDGSSLPYIEAIRSVGCLDQPYPARIAAVNAATLAESGKGLIAVAPSDGFSVTSVLSYPGTPVGVQISEYVEGRDDFASAVAPARTLGFTWEIDELLARGLARGGSLECAVVADESKYLTELRFEDEAARHKILDTVGDLYLMGVPRMRVLCVRSGHRLNNELCLKLVQNGLLELPQ